MDRSIFWIMMDSRFRGNDRERNGNDKMENGNERERQEIALKFY